MGCREEALLHHHTRRVEAENLCVWKSFIRRWSVINVVSSMMGIPIYEMTMMVCIVTSTLYLYSIGEIYRREEPVNILKIKKKENKICRMWKMFERPHMEFFRSMVLNKQINPVLTKTYLKHNTIYVRKEKEKKYIVWTVYLQYKQVFMKFFLFCKKLCTINVQYAMCVYKQFFKWLKIEFWIKLNISVYVCVREC